MLSSIKMVRKAIESMYQDTCDVVERQKVRKPDGSMKFEDVTVQSGIACRLSFQSAPSTNDTESASEKTQNIEVFLAPEIIIKAGSKLIINHLGNNVEYSNTGVAAVYNTHQEIMLELFKGWS